MKIRRRLSAGQRASRASQIGLVQGQMILARRHNAPFRRRLLHMQRLALQRRQGHVARGGKVEIGLGDVRRPAPRVKLRRQIDRQRDILQRREQRRIGAPARADPGR